MAGFCQGQVGFADKQATNNPTAIASRPGDYRTGQQGSRSVCGGIQEDRRVYDINLAHLMNHYGVYNEAELVGGAVIKFHRYHKTRKVYDVRERVSDEVAALWKRTLGWVRISTGCIVFIPPNQAIHECHREDLMSLASPLQSWAVFLSNFLGCITYLQHTSFCLLPTVLPLPPSMVSFRSFCHRDATIQL